MILLTLNERPNIEPLLAKLETALAGIRWEAVFVDDDSPAGTWRCSRTCSASVRRFGCCAASAGGAWRRLHRGHAGAVWYHGVSAAGTWQRRD